MKWKCPFIAILLFFPLFAFSQISKNFSLSTPANQHIVVLEGDPLQTFSFNWGSGRNNQSAGTFDYTIQWDRLNGDFSLPVNTIGSSCCSNLFSDTTFTASYDFWRGFINGVSNTMHGKDFKFGDTVWVKWNVFLSAVAPGPVYEFKSSQDAFVIGFVRGILNNELRPFQHKYPSNGALYTVEGDPANSVTFSWESTWCADHCGSPDFNLLIDTIDGDFSHPIFSYAVPGKDSSWSIPYTILNQFLDESRVPHTGSRHFYWKVEAMAGNKFRYSDSRRFTLFNGILNDENKPFSLINPNDKVVILIQGPGNTSLNFKWESTYTPNSTGTKYWLVLDTLGSIPVFNSPLIQVATGRGSLDTFANITYGKLMHSIDSLYGKNWTEVSFVWGAMALAGGNFFYPTSPRQINFKRGFLSGVKDQDALASVFIFPNPASKIVTFQCTEEEPVHVTLMDVSGKTIKEWTMQGIHQENIQNLDAGVFLVVLHSSSGTSYQRLVIQP